MDNCYFINVVGLIDEFVNLERLFLIKVGLINLKNFFNLLNLFWVSEIFGKCMLFLFMCLYFGWVILNVFCEFVVVLGI